MRVFSPLGLMVTVWHETKQKTKRERERERERRTRIPQIIYKILGDVKKYCQS